MATHIRILGWLYLVFGVLGLLGAVAVLVAGAGSGILASMDSVAAGAIVGGVTVFATIVIVVFALPSLLTGWGLLQRKSWSRVLAIVVGVISLVNFPFGTALGAYTLWAMFQDGTRYELAS